MEIAVCSLVVLALLFIGMSVNFSFLTGAAIFVLWTGMTTRWVAPTAFYAIQSYALLAIPLYMVAGSLMEVSGIAERLVDFADKLLKRVKGGMAGAIPVASMLFGAVCGSGTATVAAMSTIMGPRLEEKGWDKRYVAALLAASGPLGYMIPPNMNAIIYGVVANESVAALFLATVIPGILWGLLYLVINRWVYPAWYDPKKNPTLASQAVQVSYAREVAQSTWNAIPALVLVVIIFGGIYGGVFSPTEAGAVACVYAAALGLVSRKAAPGDILSGLNQTGASLGGIMAILPMVSIFTKLLITNGVPEMVAALLTSVSSNRYVILFLIQVVLFIAGFFLDAGVLLLVLTPLLLPTASLIGVDKIQLGTIIFVSIGVGTLTPPMAMNLFIVSKMFGVPIKDLLKPLLPYLLFGAIPIMLLVSYVPALSLWLPRVVMGVGS